MGFTVNSTVFHSKIASFQCPSDSDQVLQLIWPTNGQPLVAPRGNYVASWGNTVWSQQNTAGGTATRNLPAAYRASAFGHQPVRLANVTDGTSQTLFTGEVIAHQVDTAKIDALLRYRRRYAHIGHETSVEAPEGYPT
jgi:hypothetical protein